MNVDEAREVCKDCSRWRSVVSAYPHRKIMRIMYVCTSIEYVWINLCFDVLSFEKEEHVENPLTLSLKKQKILVHHCFKYSSPDCFLLPSISKLKINLLFFYVIFVHTHTHTHTHYSNNILLKKNNVQWLESPYFLSWKSRVNSPIFIM